MPRNAPPLLTCLARLLALLAVSLLISACANRKDTVRPPAENTPVTQTNSEQLAAEQPEAGKPASETLSCQKTGQQTHCRAGVAHIKVIPGFPQSMQSYTMNNQPAVLRSLNGNSHVSKC